VTTDPGRRRLTRGLIAAAAALACAMTGAVGYSIVSSSGQPPAAAAPVADAHAQHHQLEASTTAISRAELQKRYGIRLNLVAVTASGGLVDLRFTVTDAKKAKHIFTKASVMPAVVAEDSGTVLVAHHAGHHAKVTPLTGASYFVLIGNAGGVVQRGVPVSVLFNTVRVEHVTAES
jgi:hypothetical protein